MACCNQVLSRSDSSALVYRGFNFPDSPFPLPITPSPPTCTRPRSPSEFLSLSHLCVALLARFRSLAVSPVSLRVLTRFVPATSYPGPLSCKSSHIFFCTNPFVLSSFIFVYLHRPEGKELLEHLGNVVCDFLNLAWG